MADKFELALSEARKSIRRAGFCLPTPTDEGVRHYLENAEDVYQDGCLNGRFGTQAYRGLLMDETWARLRKQYGYPNDFVGRGYKLAERILLYHIKMLGSSGGSQLGRAEQAVQQHSQRQAAWYQGMAKEYLAVYQRLMPIDLFDRFGRPLGRAGVAATIALQEFRGTPAEKAAFREVVEELTNLIIRQVPRRR